MLGQWVERPGPRTVPAAAPDSSSSCLPIDHDTWHHRPHTITRTCQHYKTGVYNTGTYSTGIYSTSIERENDPHHIESSSMNTVTTRNFHRRTLGRLVLLGGLISIASTLLGCSVEGRDSFEVIPPQEIPFGLDQSTTTSTTTTTTPPENSEGSDSTTTTQVAVQTEIVEIYFVAGLDRLQRQTLQLSYPVGVYQVIAVLEEAPSGEQSTGLRTVIRPGLVAEITTNRGVANVELLGEELNELSPRDQRLAIAQLVLSLTGSLRGIGQVTFTVDGIPAEIGIPPDYTLSEPGQPLAFSDFESLLTNRSSTADVSPVDPTTTGVPGASPDDGDDQ